MKHEDLYCLVVHMICDGTGMCLPAFTPAIDGSYQTQRPVIGLTDIKRPSWSNKIRAKAFSMTA